MSGLRHAAVAERPAVYSGQHRLSDAVDRYVVNAGLAWYLFDEAVGPQRLAGIAVIIVGVVIVARS